QVLGRRVGELAHAEVVDDEERYGGEVGEVLLARAADRGVRNLLDQGVRLTIDDAVALLDGGASDGLGEMAFPGAGRAEEESVLALSSEARGGQVVREGAGHRLVEVELE